MFKHIALGSLLVGLLIACPSPNRPSTFPINAGEQWRVEFSDAQKTTLEFSMPQAAKLESDNWWYAKFTTSSNAFGGSGMLPSDRKALVLLFKLDASGGTQVGCVVPNSSNLSGARGQAVAYQNDRRIGNFECTVIRVR
jgi:hypothetical protein